MATKEDVTRLAEQLDATVAIQHLQPGWHVGVEAPAGHVWVCDTSIHELVERWYTHEADMWAALHERMRHGVTPCTIPDCEWCADTKPFHTPCTYRVDARGNWCGASMPCPIHPAPQFTNCTKCGGQMPNRDTPRWCDDCANDGPTEMQWAAG